MSSSSLTQKYPILPILIQDLLGFITGEIPAPDHQMHLSDGSGEILNLDLVSWTSTDRLVKAWITGTLSEEVLGLAVRLKIAADVWRSLTEAFSQSS
ncbi:hypothetical protein AAC387_Pa07g1737 [Persea americana]